MSRLSRNNENMSPETRPMLAPTDSASSCTTRAKLRYLPSKMPRSAQTTAITCRRGPFAPLVASTTAVPVMKPMPQAAMPTS